MRQSVFRRIFIIYLILIVAFVIITELFITASLRKSHEEALTASILKQITLVRDGVSFTGVGSEGLCREIKSRTNSRVTILAADGVVMCDSDHDAATMDNHALRPEIVQARYSAYGKAIRMSDTLKYDSVYIAQRVDRSGSIAGYVRMAHPLREADTAVASLRLKLFGLFGTILLITALYPIVQATRLRSMIVQIADFASSLAQGGFGKKMYLDRARSGEFAEIADSLNVMSEELKSSVACSDEEKERLRVILQSNPDALLIIGAKGTVRLISTSAATLFGEAARTGVPYLEIVRSPELTTLIEQVRFSKATGEAEFRIETPVERILSVRVSPLIYGNQDVSGFVAVFHDMTKISKLEQMRTDFVANVSHEIKTPLTAIRGFSETLLDGALDDRENARRFMQTIKNHAERLDSIVDDLMTLSRIELGDMPVEKSAVHPREIVDSVVVTLTSKAGQKGLDLRTRVSDEAGVVQADKDRLTQILLNLVDNAIKFTEKGSVTVGVDQREGRVNIWVKDTGIGIPREHLGRIGERFYRVDRARSREMGGTGLGLAIVKHLVRAHGWDIRIESEPGAGTTITLVVRQGAAG